MIAEGAKGSKLTVYQCLSCGHGFSLPGVGEAVLRHWYTSTSEDTLFMADERARRYTAQQILNRLTEVIPEPAHLFEIGTGPGFFLDEAHQRGWSVAGIEPAIWAVRYAVEQLKLTGINRGTYEQIFNLEGGQYDVVAAFDVIEHLIHPDNFLSACHHLLRDGGILVMTMPKFDSWFARTMGRHWHAILPAHLHYFSLASLNNILIQHGMSIERVFPHTRHLGASYLLSRALHVTGLSRIMTWNKKSKQTIILPINLRDEFEVYVRKSS